MDKKFEEIKKEYSETDAEFKKKHKYLFKDTNKGIWGAADLNTVFLFFNKIGLKGKFLDLGSGDGRVVMTASLFTDSSGIESDKELNNTAIKVKNNLKLKAQFFCKDFFEINFSSYDTIFINPDTNFFRGLEKKLLQELKGKLYVYNNIFLPQKLKRGKTFWINQVPITEFEVE